MADEHRNRPRRAERHLTCREHDFAHFGQGDVELDNRTRTVIRGGEQLALTSVEFELLEALLRSAGQIVPREELVKSILGRNFSPLDRSIDTHVSTLRKKLGHTVNGIERIKTIRNVGYLYAKTDDLAKGE